MNDDEGMPTLAYWPGDPNTPPDVEYLRQGFSGISLACDHLEMYMPAEPLTDTQQVQLDGAIRFLRMAHGIVKRLAREQQGVLAHAGQLIDGQK